MRGRDAASSQRRKERRRSTLPCFLTILEVSQKQAYIFASKQLRENAARSEDIDYLTSSAFFARAAGDLYREEENLVYAGGGHTVLQFETDAQAKDFARAVTEAALRRCPGLELFVTTIQYDPSRTPGQNLTDLSEALERKKALRKASFRQMDFGLERVPKPSKRDPIDHIQPPAGHRFPRQFEDLAKALSREDGPPENFLAVVHIDGNAMGRRVEAVYDANTGDWESCRASLRRFSEGIQADFEAAFRETVDAVAAAFPLGEDLPIRPVILAGDDVCFVTAGSIGLECARIFLEKLSARSNAEQPGQPYAACAGVALVHLKYPFYRAYALSEELCSSAKRFGARLDSGGGVSVMDWHIEFGQLKESLSALREDYRTEDGCSLELRPVAVVVPEGIDGPAPERMFSYFRALCGAMRQKEGEIARSKLKELRTALKQGEVEGAFFLQDREIGDLLYEPLRAAYPMRDWPEELKRKGAFRIFFEKDGDKKRCLFFDAIELLDHYRSIEEVSR